MKALATIGVWMHKAAPGAASVVLAALVAGCGGPEPAAPAHAPAAEPPVAAAKTCGATARTGIDCGPRGTASGLEAGAPVYDVYANGNRPSLPEIEVAALAPPPAEVEKMRFDVEVKLDPAVVPEPVSGR